MTRAGPPSPADRSSMLIAGGRPNGLTISRTYCSSPGLTKPPPHSHWPIVERSSGTTTASRSGWAVIAGGGAAGVTDGLANPPTQARRRARTDGGLLANGLVALLALLCRYTPPTLGPRRGLGTQPFNQCFYVPPPTNTMPAPP